MDQQTSKRKSMLMIFNLMGHNWYCKICGWFNKQSSQCINCKKEDLHELHN